MFTPEIRAIARSLRRSALPLLVTRIRADHKNPPFPADDLALLAHRLDRGSYFHARFALLVELFLVFLSSALATGTVAATVLRGAAQHDLLVLRAHRRMLAG